MRVVAFLADSVVVAEGKLYVHGGGWDQLTTPQLPARHPRIGVGVLIRVPYNETNSQHQFELRLEDPDGKALPLGDALPGTTADGKVRRIGSGFVVGRPPTLGAGDEQNVPIAANIDGLVFDSAGTHRFVLTIDGQDVELLPFRINLVPQLGPVMR
jgi:hypothetical protein